MKIHRFDPTVSRAIELFGSQNLHQSLIADLPAETRISCMYLAPDGIIGRHPAAAPQFALVIDGAGWVEGEPAGRVPITAGQAVFWEKGENHAAGTENGMTALVIESETLDPAALLMPPG